MRKTCCSSLRQGTAFQASLSGSSASLVLGAFLSFILLNPYLPEICVYVSISTGFPSGFRFLDNRSASCIGWHLLMISTTHESKTRGYARSNFLFSVALDLYFPPSMFGWAEYLLPSFQRLLEN